MFIARIVLTSTGSRCRFKSWRRWIIGDYSNSKTSNIIFFAQWICLYLLRPLSSLFICSVRNALDQFISTNTLWTPPYTWHCTTQLQCDCMWFVLWVRLVRCWCVTFDLCRAAITRARTIVTATSNVTALDMKLVSLHLSSFLFVFFVEKLESNGSEIGRSSSSLYGDIDLSSEEFISKWLGNLSEVQLRAEWSSWKSTHQKKYSTSVQDLERYVVWRSNRAYINYHNSFASNFGFYLAMNKFGDLVRHLCAVRVHVCYSTVVW